jgi:hypothetical protein
MESGARHHWTSSCRESKLWLAHRTAVLFYETVRPKPVELGPERIEIECEVDAARERDAPLRLGEHTYISSIAPELEDLERPQRRVDQPVPPHAEGGIIVYFLDAVAANVYRCRRYHFDYEVRRCAKRTAPRRDATSGEIRLFGESRAESLGRLEQSPR